MANGWQLRLAVGVFCEKIIRALTHREQPDRIQEAAPPAPLADEKDRFVRQKSGV